LNFGTNIIAIEMPTPRKMPTERITNSVSLKESKGVNNDNSRSIMKKDEVYEIHLSAALVACKTNIMILNTLKL
jgi:hypothetical protein